MHAGTEGQRLPMDHCWRSWWRKDHLKQGQPHVALTACCQGLCSVCLQFWGAGGCGVLYSECCPWSGALPWVSHWITPLLCPFTHCPCRGEGGSVLTSPHQNPVESSGMRAGGGALPKEPFFSFDTSFSGCLLTLLCLGFSL